MSAATVMEAALRNDVAECEKLVVRATPKPIISKGKLVRSSSVPALERAEQELATALLRLEHWLVEHDA